MKKRLFNVNFDFDKVSVNNLIEHYLKNNLKGYVCVVDGNVLTNANNNDRHYNGIINNSIINVCDGSSIAFLGNLIYRQNFSTYVGVDIFEHFTAKKYNQYFLGNTKVILDRLKRKFKSQGYKISSLKFKELPFKEVDDFDFESIAKEINLNSSDIIWVSLGAPKQEIFINNLMPYLKKGVVFGIGAAFNFYINESENRRAPKIWRLLKLEWFYRLLKEPKKIGPRAWSYLKLLPYLIVEEMKIKYGKKRIIQK